MNFHVFVRTHCVLLWSTFLTAVWLTFWLAPWQTWVSTLIWLRLGLALIIFIIPGFCVYRLLSQDPSWLNTLTFGFVISHLLIGVLGTLGRFVHFSFGFLQDTYMLLSLILLLYFSATRIRSIHFQSAYSALQNLISFWPLILIGLLAIGMSIQRVITDDDLIHMGYITSWQYATSLNFNDVFFGVDQLGSARFWIASTLFGESFLAVMGNIPAIFIAGGFYEPFLVALSVACAYELARTLGWSRAEAMASVVLQIVFLALLSEYLHPGARFFMGLSVDKGMATFIVIPVFLQSVVRYFKDSAKENLFLAFLTGLSLMMMHPIALAFAGFIVGLMVLFGLKRVNVRARAILLILLALIMVPQIALRFVSGEAQSIMPYSPQQALNFPNFVSSWGNTTFYGFNPSILAMHIPYAERIPVKPFLLQ